MAGVSLTYEIEGAQTARGIVAEALRRIDNPRSMLEEIGAYLETSVRDRFEHGQGPDGEPWEPSERAIEQGGQTLVDTAQLRDSITHRTRRTEVAVGTNKIYAGPHQFGAEELGGILVDLPPRPFLGLSDSDVDAIEDIVRQHIAEAF